MNKMGVVGKTIGLGIAGVVGYNVVKGGLKEYKMLKYKGHTRRGLKQDIKKRSRENWERGRGAKRKGNPRYKPVNRRGRDKVLRKLYVLRKK